ncbi:MAG: TetR/AcrR family transcriptional regulator [Pseudoxanthomonas sp.]
MKPRPPVELCKRGEVRVERFLDAATEIFGEKGYQHARLSEIVARAGGSLATLYRFFGDNEGLARAIIQRGLADIDLRMESLNLSALPPEQALRMVAEQIAAHMTTTHALVVHRIAIGEGQSFPDLRDWFFNHGVQSVQSKLAEYFKQETAAGRLDLPAPALAASQFFMLVFGDLVIRISSGHLRDPDPEALSHYAQSAVELFLRGALPR